MENIFEMKLTELRKKAKEYGITGFSTMGKSDLITNIYIEEAKKDNILLGSGRLDMMSDGYGFLRESTVGPDIYVSASQARKFALRNEDIVLGEVREAIGTEKNYALIKTLLINGDAPEKSTNRPFFDDLTPSYPEEKLNLSSASLSSRIIDLIAPIGKGQRGLIVAPPKAGKTILLSTLANDIINNNPEVELWILLIDERPEEVTDIKENVRDAEVFAATFDEDPSVHIKVTEDVLEKAKREVEKGKDIVILMDSLTRLARSYNIVVPSSGKLISGGIDPKALYYPKRFLGAARNIRKGGSLTIIATALIETGSKMDDIIFEEFKGTGNMEVILERSLAELRIFPAIDVLKSGTRKEEILLDEKTLKTIWNFRRYLSNYNEAEAVKKLIDLIKKTKSNDELINMISKDNSKITM